LDGNLFKDTAGNSMMTVPLRDTLNPYEYVDPLLAARLSSSAGSAFYTSMAIMAINLSLSIVFGGSLDAMWTMVNLVQLISLLPLQSIPYPPTVVIFFKMMLASHAEPGWMPNVIGDHILRREEFTVRPYTDYFEAYEYVSGSFILNSGKKFMIMIMLLVSYPFIRFMDGRYSDKHPYWHSLEDFSWDVHVQHALENFPDSLRYLLSRCHSEPTGHAFGDRGGQRIGDLCFGHSSASYVRTRLPSPSHAEELHYHFYPCLPEAVFVDNKGTEDEQPYTVHVLSLLPD